MKFFLGKCFSLTRSLFHENVILQREAKFCRNHSSIFCLDTCSKNSPCKKQTKWNHLLCLNPFVDDDSHLPSFDDHLSTIHSRSAWAIDLPVTVTQKSNQPFDFPASYNETEIIQLSVKIRIHKSCFFFSWKDILLFTNYASWCWVQLFRNTLNHTKSVCFSGAHHWSTAE